MAIQDHPRFHEWTLVLDRLVAAAEHRRHCPPGEREAADRDWENARAAYNKIADEI